MKIFLPIISLIVFTFVGATVHASKDDDKPAGRVIIIGNAFELPSESDFFLTLKRHIESSLIKTTVVISGDFTGGEFYKGKTRTDDSIRIHSIIRVISGSKNAQLIFIPGDKEWNNSGKKGYRNIKAIDKYFRNLNLPNVNFLPQDGCPGPHMVESGENLSLIVLDTQWWNHPHDKPMAIDAVCNIISEDDFLEEFDDMISETADKNILILAHYPLLSTGEFGGSFSLRQHIFPLTEINKYLYVPLPLIGTVYASFRQNIGTSKDISNSRYKPLRNKLSFQLLEHSNVIFASGHEYVMQIFGGRDNYLLNSGSVDKGNYFSKSNRLKYSSSDRGFIELTYYENGRVEANPVKYKKDDSFEIMPHILLFRSACDTVSDETPVNRKIKCKSSVSENILIEERKPLNTFQPAGQEYQAGKFKSFMLGKHYRNAWTSNISLPVLSLRDFAGGLTLIKRGGGRQTKSLWFSGGDGREYVFRSVDKDPRKALPFELRRTFVLDLTRDQTSTQHPFGAIAGDVILKNAEVIHASPELFIMPDDIALKQYRKEFAGMMGMLEERPANHSDKNLMMGNSSRIFRTYRLYNRLYKNHDDVIDGRSYARARLVDMLCGDWGRHEDNWKWAGFKNGNGYVFKPVPRDRDHIFSKWDGLLPWLADREWAKRNVEDFGSNYPDIKSLTYAARHLDRFAATAVTKQEWLEEARFLKENISDSVIHLAVSSMPPEVYDESGREIERKLNSRIKFADKMAEEFYLLLAMYVDVRGSNKREFFEVTRKDDGTVTVDMFNTGSEKFSKGDRLLYHRKFYPRETKEIRLYGLGGDDVFTLSGEAKNSIRVRIIPGSGRDIVIDESKVRHPGKHTLVYEKSIMSTMVKSVETKVSKPVHDETNYYERKAFEYNSYLPYPLAGYNGDDGFRAGAGIDFLNHSFGKKDFSSKHRMQGLWSAGGAKLVKTESRFHEAIRSFDIIVNSDFELPSLSFNYFGEGNKSVKNDFHYRSGYYTLRHQIIHVESGMVKTFWNSSEVMATISGKWIKADNTALSEFNPVFIQTEDADVVLSSAVIADFDFTDNKALPKKGIRLYSSASKNFMINHENRNFTMLEFFIENYTTPSFHKSATLGLKAGTQLSEGDLPYYMKPGLGQNNYLKGFVKNRFAGNDIFYVNTELRYEIAEVQNSFLPFKIGVNVFSDAGKVMDDGKPFTDLHFSYGGGIFVIPVYRSFTLSLNVGFSDEERGIILFNLGSVIH